MTTAISLADKERNLGVLAALGAFGLWGFAPLYFKLLGDIDATEIIAHRVIWSFVFLWVVLMFRHGKGVFAHIRLPRKTMLVLFGTGLLIGANWLIFVFAVNSGQVLSTSLGYFINPLVSVFLGMVVFKEHLNGLQIIAVVLAGIGTLYLTVAGGTFPWIALSLAISFGFYGMIRKQLEVGPMVGLFWETMLVLPLAVGWMLWMGSKGDLRGDVTSDVDGIILIGTGLMTVLPLLLFAAGVRRLYLSTMGLMQYIAPSISFSMAVFLFKEPFGLEHAITFGCIWVGLCLYSYSSWKNRVRSR